MRENPTKQKLKFMNTSIRNISSVVAALAAFDVQAQTNIVIQSPSIAADQTAQITWNSQSGAVYQVWSSDSLSDVGAQGLHWTIREANCASKGTNTEWMDVGDPLWIPRILPPRFQPTRFYRVQQVDQAILTPPIVTVELSQSNGLVFGDLYASVNVTLVDTNQQLSDVSVIVDGQKFYTSGNYSFTAFINSCEWPNGLHQIYAVATMVDEAESLPFSDDESATNAANIGIGVSGSQFVTFSNYISPFFVSVPFFDPTAGQTQEVVATFPEDTCWRLTVLNYQDTPVRQFTNQSPSLYVAWDGNDDSGNPLPFGFYDYYIEARPGQFGCPSGVGSFTASSMSASALSTPNQSGSPSAASAKASVFSRAAMQFTRSARGISEHVAIPSLNPTPAPVEMTTFAIPEYVMTYSIAEDGATNEFINGLPAFLYPPGFPLIGENAILSDFTSTDALAVNGANSPQPLGFGDGVYTTRTPTRVPGSLFMGYAGTIGVAYQGHHPTSPRFALPAGGVIAPTLPPYGRIKSASKVASSFISVMGASAWRTAFSLGDDNLNSTNLSPLAGPGTGTSTFATKCNFGMYVGHMTATAYNDPAYQCTHSWIPIYNSYRPVQAYEWLALPSLDFGPPNGASPLLWMALFGCNSLQTQDWNDMWSTFLLPMPPNLRLLLGSQEGIFIHPIFGWRFAADLNGLATPNNMPMTIADSWYDAASAADEEASKSLRRLIDPMGTRHMTVSYRDDTQGGTWKTIQDTIWNWSNDISYDWFDVSLDEQQVYP
jgi:hypothetical protein